MSTQRNYRPRTGDHFQQIKDAARGRCGELIGALTALSPDVVRRGSTDHPCPYCNGHSVVWPDTRDGGADLHGRIACRNCTDNRPKGDIIATIAAFLNIDRAEAGELIAYQLGLTFECRDAGNRQQPSEVFSALETAENRQAVDVITQVALSKQMPVESFRKYGAEAHHYGREQRLVARVPMYDQTGERCGWFILPPGEKGKCSRGSTHGLHLPNGRLPEPGTEVCIVEGVKDAAALDGLGYFAVGLATNQMRADLAVAFRDCDVVIVPDLDNGGDFNVRRTGSRLVGIAASIRVARLPGDHRPTGGDDVRDVLRREGGARMVHDAIRGAGEWTPQAIDEKPTVMLNIADPQSNVDAVITCLGRLGWDTPWIPDDKMEESKVYQRGDVLVSIAVSRGEREREPYPRIKTLDDAQLRLRIMSACTPTQAGLEGSTSTLPPGWLLKGVQSSVFGDSIRHLSGIVSTPTLRSDWSILQDVGYDELSGLVLIPTEDFPEIIDSPSKNEVDAAYHRIAEVVCDFPFAGECYRAAWVAMLFTMVCRHMVKGPVPMFPVDANVRGSGKSKLVDAAALIAYDYEAPRQTLPGSDEETRKLITTMVHEGHQMKLLDNVSGMVQSDALDAALTSDRWTDRILGESRAIEVMLRTVFTMTGNNLEFAGDLARRIIPIKLQSNEQNPEDRETSEFRHPNLLAWIKENRVNFVSDVLTVMRGYFLAGRPASARVIGSYEAWCNTIASAVHWCSGIDPVASVDAYKASDRSLLSAERWIAGLKEIDPNGQGIKASDILVAHWALPALREITLEEGADYGRPSSVKIGKALRKIRDRVVEHRDGLLVTKEWITGESDRKGFTIWKVETERSLA